jgi:hypothetical protein
MLDILVIPILWQTGFNLESVSSEEITLVSGSLLLEENFLLLLISILGQGDDLKNVLIPGEGKFLTFR